MEIVFAVLVLLLIIAGLRNRKKEKKEWVKEERYEESGDWLDKRSGERGTYGSLDEEMEANRLHIGLQSKINALAQQIQNTCFTQHPDFHTRSNEQVKKHLAFCKAEIRGLFEQMDALIQSRPINIAEKDLVPNDLRVVLKKQVLEFSFESFPKLLDLEIEQIRQFDTAAEMLAQKILAEIDRMKE